MTKVTVDLDEELVRRLRAHADHQGQTVEDIVRISLTRSLVLAVAEYREQTGAPLAKTGHRVTAPSEDAGASAIFQAMPSDLFAQAEALQRRFGEPNSNTTDLLRNDREAR